MTREEAIKLLVNATFSDEWQGNEDLTTAYNMAIEALSEPTRPKAKWIRNKFMFVTCSCCGYYRDTTDNEGNTIPDNYCPNCGAEMECE